MITCSTYAAVQFLAFVASCASMAAYALAALTVARASVIEAVLLLVRAGNELNAGHMDIFDVLHHSGTLLGLFILASRTDFLPFAWLGVHMQALHLPMALWYAGGRRDCVLPSRQTQCKNIFRWTWLAAAAYRFALLSVTAMLQSGLVGPKANTGEPLGSTVVVFTCTVFNVLFVTLDLYWTKCFFAGGGVGWPSLAAAVSAVAAGGVIGGVVAAAH